MSFEEPGADVPMEFPKPAEPTQADPTLLLLLMPLAVVLMVGLTVLLMKYSTAVFMTIGLGALLAPFFWLFVSAFRPAMPERECPGCGANELVLIDPQEEYGVRCLVCDYKDQELRIPYMKDIMNDPEIAAQAGFVIDEYGQAHLPQK